MFSAFVIFSGVYKIIPLAVIVLFEFLVATNGVHLPGYQPHDTLSGSSSQATEGMQFLKHSPYGTIRVEDSELFIDERKQCGFLWGSNATESEMSRHAIEPLKDKHEKLSVLNIGLGCGLTLSRVLKYPNVNADIVEINPVVVEANRRFSEVLTHSRANLILNDGLSYLRETKKKYHSILIDIEEPSVAYSSNLYTVEAFKIIYSALNTDGTFALWNYQKAGPDKNRSPRYFNILYYSLKEVFPYVYSYPDVFLASKQKLNGQEYMPKGAYKVNTINKNTLTPAFLEDYPDGVLP